MSTFAKNIEGRVLSARESVRGTDYFCLECGSPVRLRLGEERRAHFYHTEPREDCRESGKSLEHLMTQFHIQKAFPGAILERRFPEVARIADVALMKEKLIFEIQCSQMTAVEAIARTRDYNSLGFTVIWVLHTKTFLKQKATAFESSLGIHYFTDIDDMGEGDVFDIFAPIQKGYREKHSKRFPIELCFQKNLYQFFRREWQISFSGDILSHLMQKSLDEETRGSIFHHLFVGKEEESALTLTEQFKFYARFYFERWLRSSC